ncbi:nucleoside diphosphate kinase regulator [Nitrosococcus watsonii]|uniref:GreA/GreB family elongation factor n=1 Tax=Nitrosococcus watsoni (strain C-113) TaxID=105559 RepID=D8K6R1_NITWC|nr:nucleoside diphosphate kinase regulator [Nitrosococcus watsonii]ADJ28588.1 GreA/GreB family elongation factor [Nitrosococcus watsonii C-113]
MLKTSDLIITDLDYGRLRALGEQTLLAEELDRATVIPRERVPDRVVTMHSRLIYLDENTGERREVELVYPEEANMRAGKISVLAPVGSALLGLSVGESIDWKFPSGEVRRLSVERILFQPQHDPVRADQ